jgi:streptogramin lyase
MSLLAPGEVLAGYRIESVVGRGGMGVVYRAVELGLERVVALKVIAPELIEDADVRARFLYEARAAASIEHPHVIPVHAAGERDGLAFLAMRYVEGDDARSLVRRSGALAAGHAADIVAQAGAGLDAIHRAGYVHRDVKPANVLIDADGHVYVTDFGLAKQVLAQVSTRTGSGHWVGTLDYVAPEQIRGGAVDARADVYALGGVLCYLLTGHVPFERDGDEAKLWAQLSEPPPVPSALVPGIARGLDAVVYRAMAKQPAERFPSAGDLGRAALAAAAGTAPSAPERVVARGAAAPGGARPEIGLAAESPTLTARRPATALTTAVERPQRSRRLLGLGVGAGLAAVVAAVLLWPDGRDPQTHAVQQPPATATPTPAFRIVRTIERVGHRPNGIVVAAGTVWVTSYDRDEVERIDAASGRRLKPVPVGRGASAIVTDGRSVWVTAKQDGEVVRIDARSGRIVDQLRPGGTPFKLAIGMGSLWAAVSRGVTRSTELVRFGARGVELARVPLARGVAGITTVAGSVWVVDRLPPHRIMRIDPRTHARRYWLQVPGDVKQLTDDGKDLWATLSRDLVTRIYTDRRNHQPVGVGSTPQTLTAAGGHVFVTNNADQSLSVLDQDSGKASRETIALSDNPFAICADDHSLWVTGTAGNTVTQIAYN